MARPRIPGVVWLLVAAQLVVLGAYSILLPTYRAPDEPAHVDLVRHLAAGHGYPDFDARDIDPAIIRSLKYVRFATKSRHLAADEALPRSQRPSFADLSPPKTTQPAPHGAARILSPTRYSESTRYYNQMPHHPPLYYAVVAAGTRVVRAVVPGNPFRAFDSEVGLMRLVSLLLLVPLPLLVWLAAVRLRLPRSAALTAALVPFAIPQVAHVGSAVNNDTLLLTCSAGLTISVVALAMGDLRTQVLVGAGIWTGLAMLTKAYALAYPVWVLAAIALGRARTRERVRAKDVGAYAATAFVAGGWWYARNLVRFHAVARSADSSRFTSAPKGFSPDWWSWFSEGMRRVALTFWGNFGWYETRIPDRITEAGLILFGVAAVVAFVAGRRRLRRSNDGGALPNRAVVLLLVMPTALLLAFSLALSANAYGSSGKAAGLQGRYMFGGRPPAAHVVGRALMVLARRAPRVARLAPVGMLGVIAFMHWEALRTVLRYYWGHVTDGVGGQIHGVVAWAPWPSRLVVVEAVAGAVILIGAGVVVVRAALVDPSTGLVAAPAGAPAGTSREHVAMTRGAR